MRPASLALWLAFAAWPLFQAACSSDTQCSCVVQNNGESRTLACGDTACVGGTSMNCAENGKSIPRGACTAPPAASESASGTGGGLSTTPDPSCDDLLTFCNTSCRSPATAAADCQTTASSGDATACAGWQLSSGVVCSP